MARFYCKDKDTKFPEAVELSRMPSRGSTKDAPR
jgi:hypothetical protein